MPPSSPYELVIGLETHIQLATASKMFCACAVRPDAPEPNRFCCPTCLGLPGALPSPNLGAVGLALRLGLALGCTVHERTLFERKNYFYPDLTKGYQISQFRQPLCSGGSLPIGEGEAARRIGLERLHLEEDTGKLDHGAELTRIDYNRSGIPLVELVTLPQMRSPEEAALYVETLRHLLRWLGVSSGRMADGALRVDVNCSLRLWGAEDLGTKVEVKNLNTIAAVRDALAYEASRQAALLDQGQRVRQETRGWLEDQGRTVSQRSKEEAADYRYFPEPDLPPLQLPEGLQDEARAALPELPWERRARLVAAVGLKSEEARLFTRSKATADYLEAALATGGAPPRAIASWLSGAYFAQLRALGMEIEEAEGRVPPAALARLVAMVEGRRISAASGKELLAEMFAGDAMDPKDPEALAAARGLAQVGDTEQLAAWVAEAIAAHPQAVADYRGGKTGVLSFLVGAVMKASRGRADAAALRDLMTQALDGPRTDPATASEVAAGSDSTPSDSTPSDSTPSDSAPSDSAPSDSAPSDSAPSDVVASEAVASEAARGGAARPAVGG